MNSEGAPEYFVDQGLYYPTPTNYGYYSTGQPCLCIFNVYSTIVLSYDFLILCPYILLHASPSGFESPAEWDDQQSGFGLDAQDVQYAVSSLVITTLFLHPLNLNLICFLCCFFSLLDFSFQGAQAETSPFLYYTPSFGYGHSPYNPYNPYIPGAMLGVDGQFLGTPHYYTIPSYDNSSSSLAYFPVPAYSTSDVTEINTANISIDANSSIANGSYTPPILMRNLSPASSAFTPTHLGPSASSKTNSFTGISEGTVKGPVTGKRPMAHSSVVSSSLSRPTSNQILQVRTFYFT